MNRHCVPNAILGYPGKPINGGSHPRFYDFDDGVPRLVKWHPSNHGHKACYNELIASRLGQLIGAPILRGGLVFVPADVIPADHAAFGAKEGFHFGTARMQGENFIPAQHYKDIDNRAELPYAAVLLGWLGVGDQHGHNQFLQRLEVEYGPGLSKQTKRFRLIDMGFMFGNPGWTHAGITQVHTTYPLPSHLVQAISKDKFHIAIDELKALDVSLIRDCFEDFPNEWGILPEDKQAAIQRVLGTQQQIENILRNGNPTLF